MDGGGVAELGLQQVEHVADRDELLQLLVGQADAKAAFDLGDDADDVHRVEAEPLAEVGGVVQVGVLLARVRLEAYLSACDG